MHSIGRCALLYAWSCSSLIQAQQFDIPTTLWDLGGLDTLSELLDDIDLDENLSSQSGQFTFFAPIDTAFESLPQDFVDCLLKEENVQALTDVLLYHAIPGAVSSSNLGSTKTSINGEVINFKSTNGNNIVINSMANVIGPNEMASNGRIHVIDSVLIPPSISIDSFTAVCNSVATPPPPPLDDLPTTAANTGEFRIVITAFQTAGLTVAIDGNNGPYTILAPENDAFTRLPAGFLECLLKPQSSSTLSSILNYHVLLGSRFSDDFVNGTTIRTLNGEKVQVDVSEDGVRFDGSSFIVDSDIEASNGVLQGIDTVLAPPSFDYDDFIASCGPSPTEAPTFALDDILSILEDSENYGKVLNALDVADYDLALVAPNGPYTFFAPTNSAFDSLPPTLLPCLFLEENLNTLLSILNYHLVNGEFLSTDLPATLMSLNGQPISFDDSTGNIAINGIENDIEIADIPASNGVVHVIDYVLIPPSMNIMSFLSGCGATPEPTPMPTKSPTVSPSANPTKAPTLSPTVTANTVDISAIAASSRSFRILSTLLESTGLDGTLADPEMPFTVFAPSDNAFSALPNGLLTCLLLPENDETLSTIVNYHIVRGAMSSTMILDGMTPETFAPTETILINIVPPRVISLNDDVTVITTDITATNGFIHMIDRVLIPSSVDLDEIQASCFKDEDENEETSDIVNDNIEPSRVEGVPNHANQPRSSATKMVSYGSSSGFVSKCLVSMTMSMALGSATMVFFSL